ncbi:MAG: WG repeat-containing protein [Saprospiraceae bacterium]
MKNLFVLFFALLSINSIIAQNEKPPPPPPEIMEVPAEEIMEEEPVFMDQEIEEDVNYNSEYKRKQNNKYATSKIFDEYEWFYEKNGSSYSKKYGILKRGEVLLPLIFSATTYNSTGTKQYVMGIEKTFGLYNVEAENWDIPISYESLSYLNKNLYSAQLNNRFGIIDGNNNIITDFKWSRVSSISGLENYFVVADYSQPARLSGVYSVTGKKLIIPCKYTRIEKISSENYFLVTKGTEKNIIDINDKSRFKTWYDELFMLQGGRKLYIVKENGKMGIIDEDEKQIVPIEYQSIANYPYKDGSYLARNKDGKYGCLSADGTITLPFEYDQLTKSGYNNMITAKNNKCGILQINNGLPYEIATCDYDDISRGEKVFIVEKNKKFGIMDFYGKMITKFDFDLIESLSPEIYVAKKKNNWFLLNNNGSEINGKSYKNIERISDKVKQQNYYTSKNFSYLKTQNSKNKYGIIDKLGSEVVPPIFDDILSEAKNVVIVKKNSKFGLYDLLKKSMVLSSEYDNIIFDKKGYYGFKGNEIYFISNRENYKATKL